jgi:Glycosyl transferase family 2
MPSSGAIGEIPFTDVFDMDAPPKVDVPDGPVAVSLCHNEMLRLPDFLRHHRSIGIRHFFVVDNGSTDGSGAYLDAQPDVTRLFTAKPYREFKPIFRTWPADHYAAGRWLCEPDIDEHLVYPGWPERPLAPLLAHWDGAGFEAIFAPMVDMYAPRPAGSVVHDHAQPLLSTFDHFDGAGYWIAPPRPGTLSQYPTPPYLLFGGCRPRIGVDRLPAWQRRAVRAAGKKLMDYRDRRCPRPGAQFVFHRLFTMLNFDTGVRSKIALVRWQKGMSFAGSNHRLGQRLSLAPDWVALLHFRMTPDYVERETAWRARKNRRDADGAQRVLHMAEVDPVWEGSRRLHSWRELHEAGLIRVSPDLAAALDLPQDV